MQAVILAGGKGTRLLPLTLNVPKPMVPVREKPFLEYQLRLLKRQGFVDIVLCVGYLAEMVKEHFGDGAKFGVNIAYSVEDALLGTAGALRLAHGRLADEFLLLNGDTYLDIPYRAVIDFHKKEHAAGTVVVYNNRLNLADNNVILRGSHIASYGASGAANGVDAGVYVFNKEAVGRIDAGRQISLKDGILDPLIGAGALRGYHTLQRYYDIGTFERLRVFEKEVAV